MGNKPRLVLVTDQMMLADLQCGQDSLAVPRLVAGLGGWYADADDLRAWLALKSGTAPTVEDGGQAEAGHSPSTSEVEAVLRRARMMEPAFPRTHVIRTKWGKGYTADGFRALWQRTIRRYETLTGIKANRAHFHDIRAKSISDNASLDNAYLLAGHIDIKMTRRTYDRNRRRVEPLR